MKLLISIMAFLIISCSGNCEDLNTKFSSYKEAISLVRDTSFKIEDKVNTDSSWIDSIEYYSCDGTTGFLIVNTNSGRSYIHENVPNEVWNGFKRAYSFGMFYNQNIKGNYFLSLN